MALNSRGLADMYFKFLKEAFLQLDEADRRALWRGLGRNESCFDEALCHGKGFPSKLESEFEGQHTYVTCH